MTTMAIIVPSRGRPQSIAELVDDLERAKTSSSLYVVVDEDDPTLEEYKKLSVELEFNYMITEREGKGMAKPLNKAAKFLSDAGWYDHFCFLGDDHRPRTVDWDMELINKLDELGTGVVYGNDLFQGEALPTAVAMSGNIVKALGGMVPPGMIHLYLDNFWLQLGRDLNAICYLPEVIIEHLHPVAGKGEWDDQYREVNAEEVYSADAIAFKEYMASNAYQELLAVLR